MSRGYFAVLIFCIAATNVITYFVSAGGYMKMDRKSRIMQKIEKEREKEMNQLHPITMNGNPLTLTGEMLSVGQKAPDFIVSANDLSQVTLADYAGKIKLISVVPSLDTKVCSLQTKRFNTEAQKLGENIVVLTISMDLPFAQSRYALRLSESIIRQQLRPSH